MSDHGLPGNEEVFARNTNEKTDQGIHPTSSLHASLTLTTDAASNAAQSPVGTEDDLTSGEEFEYPQGAKLFLISVALCLAVFLISLDNTIIATAVPHITDQFQSLPGESTPPEWSC